MQKENDLKLPENKQEKVLVLAKTLWLNRKTFWKSIIIAGVIGIVISFLSPKEYVSWTTMVPQTKNPASKLGNISSLAAMAGLNLDMAAGDELSPAIYPQIIGSVLYQMELMNTSFNVEGCDRPVNLYTYYTEYAKLGILYNTGAFLIGLPGKIADIFSGEPKIKSRAEGSPIYLTKKEEKVRKLIEKQVSMNVDSKNGYVTLYTAFPEAELSAEVADKARELLQKYITEFKIKKATEQLNFIEERYKENKAAFLKAQKNLAYFRDQNKNISSAIAATEEERLKSEYSIATSVYNELTKQFEQAKIQVKEDTPVFSVIQPAKVPLKKSKPNKILTITVWLFLGVIVGLGIIFGREYINDIKLQLGKTDNK